MARRGPPLRLLALVLLRALLAPDAARLHPPARQDAALLSASALLPADVVGRVLDLVPFRSRLASVGSRAVTFWDAGGAHHEVRFRLPPTDAAFFPDKRRVLVWGHSAGAVAVAGARRGLAEIWDVVSGEALQSFLYEGYVASAHIFPGGDRLLLCDGVACRVLRTASGEEIVSFGADWSRHLEVSPSGDSLLMYHSSSRFSVRDAATLRVICQSAEARHAVEEDIDVAMHMFPHGDRLVSANIRSSVATVWSASTCEPALQLRHPQPVWDVVVLGGGTLVACAWGIDDRSAGLSVWNADTGQRMRDLHAPRMGMAIWPFIWPDCLAVQGPEAMTLWNVTSGAVIRQFAELGEDREDGLFRHITGSPGGEVMATCSGEAVTVWDVASGEKLHIFNTTGGDHTVSLRLGGAADPHGVGRGWSWRELPWHRLDTL